MDHLAPVALFAYNRPDHLEKTISALQANDLAQSTEVFIFCDGPKSAADLASVEAVRQLANQTDGFLKVEVVQRAENYGLAKSIITGVTKLTEAYGRVIVIEDDIVLASSALTYFNRMLVQYQGHQEVFSISGFNFPPDRLEIPRDYEFDVYAIPRMQCWGWATWHDKWLKADFDMADYAAFKASRSLTNAYGHRIGFDSLNTLDRCMRGEKDVWACRWVYTHFKHNALCLCPTQSLVNNIGLDGSGQNSGCEEMNNDTLSMGKNTWRVPHFAFVDDTIFERFMGCFFQRKEFKNSAPRPLVVRIVGKLQKVLGLA